MTVESIITFLAGMGLLLYGIKIMGEGLELAAGAKLKSLLEKMTNNKFLAVIVGFVITTLIQSSTATTVMVVGFVNTGIMNLTQAIGVIMGANIGTTTTSILVSLNLGMIAPVAIAIGVTFITFSKKNMLKHIGLALTGFGMLFLGMRLMQEAMAPLQDSVVFKNWILNANSPVLGIIIGAAIAALIHSSAASIGILQALASQGLIPLHFAVFVIYGQNIGTCITALISALGTKTNSKRTAVMHVLFNLFGTLTFLLITFFLPFVSWIESVSDNTMMQLSLVHIIFNVVSTLIMFPFSKVLVKLSCLIVPDRKGSADNDFRMLYVDDLMINTPPFAVAQVSKEVHRMALLARDNFKLAAADLLNASTEHKEDIQHTEEVINYINHTLTPLLVKINALDLSYQDAKYIGRVFHVINDIERIGDHAVNLSEAAESRANENIQFSPEGESELQEMFDTTIKLLDGAIEVFTNQNLDYDKAMELNHLEASIDDMQRDFEQNHIDRLNKHICETRAGMLFINTVTDFERVGDHATNIAWKVSNKPQIAG
ncbi:MAG: Na/Pi cotransporter family protein [Ruminococcaceae bacterium]|nr:Na/Pi cotransporter family protein [Oscillospiraceae bacterium]